MFNVSERSSGKLRICPFAKAGDPSLGRDSWHLLASLSISYLWSMPVFVRGPILCITVQPRSQLKNWVLSFAPAAGPTWPTKNKTVLPFCQVPLSVLEVYASACFCNCLGLLSSG